MILLCKALYKAFAVFVQSSLQVVCHAGVQDSISFVGQKVDIILFHALTAFLGVEFAEAFLLSERVLRDCHVGLRPPRNDKSGGQHCFNGGRYGSGMLSRDCTPRALPRASRSGRHVGLWPPRNDKPLAFAILTTACLLRRCGAGRGQPGPYKARAFARRSVQIGSAFPRLPRAQSALAMTNLEALCIPRSMIHSTLAHPA